MTEANGSWATNEGSRYVTDELYEQLREAAARSNTLGRSLDAAATAEAASLVHFEARLLDEGRYGEWTALFTEDCIYWVPITPGGGDPRSEWSLVFDDRRRLLDRVAWLEAGWVHPRNPAPTTCRLVSNVEAFDQPDGMRLVRSNFCIHESRRGRMRTWVGSYEHVLRRDGDAWLIHRKRAMLVDSAEAHENLVIIL
ncbi:MAG TPA: aromatic-ring-hydroxylating dioxygenase subunit beta [Candidatus Dormibacteraeota bacterium]|jgi:3-phenylpropionate/cinnamic acid dioxygenase small subunit|nr:aromatic-ring-hydroxylating dioxygenase subunit beta [Candidatus Dormibacteraeota bacterium]